MCRCAHKATCAYCPLSVDAAAFRIVQESLTNVLRHAAAQEVYLAIAIEGRTLWLRIADDGSGAAHTCHAGQRHSGHGRTRARLLGGMLTAGPIAAGGFEVVAAFPLKIGSET